MTVVHVIVPARGGSKRVPRKNLADLGGRPLIAWTIAAAMDAGMGADLYVSTEDAEIAGAAHRFGARVIDRPVELAADYATTEQVLLHALGCIDFAPDDLVMTLAPTSPLRSPLTIQRFASLGYIGFVEDSLVSTHENRGDFWRYEHDTWGRLFPDAPRSQLARSPMWEENGVVYLTKIRALLETGSILGRRPRCVAVPVEESFDVNTEWDLEIVRAVVSARRNRT